MTVGTYVRPNYTAQSGTVYPAGIDAMAAVFERHAQAFAPHEQTAGSPAPDLTVVVDAGAVLDLSGSTPDLNEAAQQTVSGFTIPAAGQTRVDRIVINETTGAAIRVAGTPQTTAGSPTAAAPDIPAATWPVCRVTIASADTAITNDMIVDERCGVPIKQKFALRDIAGYLFGLTLSNNAVDATNDIDVATGVAVDSTDAYAIRLASAITKQLDAAWAVGTNAGGLDTGVIANNTYHVHLIARSDTGLVDVLFSLSATAPTMPANYNFRRRIGSIIRTAAAIVLFTQEGDYFRRNASVLDVDVTNPGTAAVTRTLSVPTGVNLFAIFNSYVQSGVGVNPGTYYSDLSSNNEAASSTLAPLYSIGGSSGSTNIGAMLTIRTNNSAQIRSRMEASDANSFLRIATLGWIDRRGRDA